MDAPQVEAKVEEVQEEPKPEQKEEKNLHIGYIVEPISWIAEKSKNER